MQPQEDYKIVQERSPKALATAVHNEMVSHERWQPIGGIAVATGNEMFYQAMLRGRRGGTRTTRRLRRRA